VPAARKLRKFSAEILCSRLPTAPAPPPRAQHHHPLAANSPLGRVRAFQMLDYDDPENPPKVPHHLGANHPMLNYKKSLRRGNGGRGGRGGRGRGRGRGAA